MTDLLQFSSAWREISGLLEERRSSILVAPRYYGKWTFLQKYSKSQSSISDLKWLTLSSRIPTLGTDLEYSWLWDTVRTQLGSKRRLKVVDSSSFIAAVESVLDDVNSHVVVCVGGAGRGHEENHYRVLSTLQRLLRTGKLTVVATDDYSSFYFQKQNFLVSDLHSFLRVQVAPTTPVEIAAYIRAVAGEDRLSADYVAGTSTGVYARSGGHIGIAQEVLRGLERDSWPPFGASWDTCVEDLLRRSVVLESISRALEEDAEGYARTAIEYRSPACPEQNSPRIHVLRQLGVLHRTDPLLLRLCEGAITNLIDGLWRGIATGSPRRVGTIMSESGPRIFEAGPVKLTDDDLVVLHLSDLHVGEQYQHRLQWKGGQLNPNEHFAGELLRDDLESLGLLGRVDGMVLSGDFVWNGSAIEFRRARTVLEELLSEVKLDLSNVLLIPGNHDVEWNPGNLSSPSFGKLVSRESYDEFLKLLGKTQQGEVEVLHLVSRSKRTNLQIVGIDSNRVEGPDAAGIGFVSRDALISAKKAIEEFRSEPTADVRKLNWLVVHHHIFPSTSTSLADAQGRMVSTMANAAEVLDYANQLKVEVILHGHEHQPCVTVARRWPVDVGDVFAPIAAIGAGSFGAKREHLGPFSRNHYYVIVRRQDGILIRSRHQGTGGVKFVPHSDMWLPR